MPRAPKEKTATRNKRPLKKEKHFMDESCIELCTCAKTMQQDKAAAKPPKTNHREENFYKVDGYKSNHYRKPCSRIIHSVRNLVLRTAVHKWTRQKEIQQEPAQGRKVLVKQKGSTMNALKAISKYVLALGNMHKEKAAAKPPKTNRHEKNFYKVDGCKSNHYRKHCSRIMHSVPKLVLRTVVDQ